MKVSFVCPTHNRTGMLYRLYESLVLCNGGTEDWELIVIDSGGEQDTEDYLKGRPNVQHRIMFQYPFNLAKAHNAGAELASGDVICFVNDDVAFLCSDLVSGVHQHFAANPVIGLVTPLSDVARVQFRKEHFSPFSPSPGLGVDLNLWCYGDAQFYRTHAFHKMGGWEDRLWGYGYTEADQCARLLLAGYRAAQVSMEIVNFRAERRNSWWGCNEALRVNEELFPRLYEIPGGQYQQDASCYHTFADWLKDEWAPAVWAQTDWKLDLFGLGEKREGFTRIGDDASPDVDLRCVRRYEAIPWPAGTVSEIDTDVGWLYLMNEAERVLKPGGTISRKGKLIWTKL